MSLAWVALVGLAHAHGAAPAVLDVLAWTDSDDGCDATPDGRVPAVVRTNIGLAAWGEDVAPFAYVCPSRWTGTEGALSAASADGRELLVARDGVIAWSPDGGCTFQVTASDPGDSVVGVARDGDGFLVAVRRFDGQPSGLISVVHGEVHDLARWEDAAPDGVVVTGGQVWVSGATPAPWAARVEEGARVEDVSLPALDGLDRLTPRAVDGAVWLTAGAGGSRWLWRVDDGVATSVVGPAAALFGPARVGDAWWAALDGQAWSSPDGQVWTDSGQTVGWTCLGSLDGQPFACNFTSLDLLYPGDGLPTQSRVFSLNQIDGPELGRCDDVDGACELDWYHFGGESGWVGTQGGTCPIDARTAISDTDDPGHAPPTECGCANGGTSTGGLAVLAALVWRRRRPTTVR